MAGGTGSGLTTKVLETMRDNGIKPNTVATFNIYPSGKLATSAVECYNSVFATKDMLELQADSFVDWHACFNNGTLYDQLTHK